MSQTVEKCVWSNVLATWGLNKEIGKIEKKTIMNWGKKKTIMETKIQAGLHLLQSRDTVRLKPFTF